MLARPARRTLDVMSLAARPIWLSSDVNAPVAAGKPIIPSRMYVSRVMPAREAASDGGGLQLGIGRSASIAWIVGTTDGPTQGRERRAWVPAADALSVAPDLSTPTEGPM